MTFNLELLTPTRFQQLCQSLLLKEFPGLQCLPTDQADGGRDAIVGSTVIQVKATPARAKGIAEWIIKSLKQELPKIERLSATGLLRYVLVVRAEGSARLTTGARDKVTAWMKGNITCETICLWRSDIERRLDANPSIIWQFPEIARGADVLGLLLDKKPRLLDVARAYLADRYSAEVSTRFQQIDLDCALEQIYVDPPVRVSPPCSADDIARVNEGNAPYAFDADDADSDGDGRDDAEPTLRSTLLANLDPSAPSPWRRVAIIGGPGQGKSTATQSLAQFWRTELLPSVGASHPPHRGSDRRMGRLPVRFELTDLVAWAGTATLSATPTLESFLASTIGRRSGGDHVEVDDVRELFRMLPVAIIADAMDEVADPSARIRALNECIAGCDRLYANGIDICLIVATRPTAVADERRALSQEFATLYVRPLQPAQIAEFTRRWIAHKRPDDATRRQLTQFTKDRMSEPHIRGLSRNAMQLSILLSLIGRRGVSLPDRRTLLYSDYVGLFFDRESAKSEHVARSRDLLLRFHGAIAWEIHARAEAGELARGIPSALLRTRLENLLDKAEQPRSLASALLASGVDRLVMLVNRNPGEFEFDVLPLREYFAAYHLYETAPYSKPGRPAPGNKIDVLQAIRGRPHWTNVLRFYAGHFDRGELPALVDELTQDVRSAAQQMSVGVLASQVYGVLADWSLEQDPASVRRAVQFLLRIAQEQGPLEFVIQGESDGPLPDRCGGADLQEGLWRVATTTPNAEWSESVGRAVAALAGDRRYTTLFGERFDEIAGIERLLALGRVDYALRSVDRARLESRLGHETADETVALLYQAGRSDMILDHPARTSALMRVVHSPVGFRLPLFSTQSKLGRYMLLLRLAHLTCGRPKSDDLMLHGLVSRFESAVGRPAQKLVGERVSATLQIEPVVREFDEWLPRPAVLWRASIAPWKAMELSMVGTGAASFAPRVFALMALFIGAEGGHTVTKASAAVSRGTSVERYAQLGASLTDEGLWTDVLAEATSTHSRSVWCAAALLAAPRRVLAQHWSQLAATLESLDGREFLGLLLELERFRSLGLSRAVDPSDWGAGAVLDRPCVALACARGRPLSRKLVGRELSPAAAADPVCATWMTEFALNAAESQVRCWEWVLSYGEASVRCGGAVHGVSAARVRAVWGWELPEPGPRLARQVLVQPEAYPRVIVAAADLALRGKPSTRARSVLSVARSRDWEVAAGLV